MCGCFIFQLRCNSLRGWATSSDLSDCLSSFFPGTWYGAVCTGGYIDTQAKLLPSPGRALGSGTTLPGEAEAATN